MTMILITMLLIDNDDADDYGWWWEIWWWWRLRQMMTVNDDSHDDITNDHDSNNDAAHRQWRCWAGVGVSRDTDQMTWLHCRWRQRSSDVVLPEEHYQPSASEGCRLRQVPSPNRHRHSHFIRLCTLYTSSSMELIPATNEHLHVI